MSTVQYAELKQIVVLALLIKNLLFPLSVSHIKIMIMTNYS